MPAWKGIVGKSFSVRRSAGYVDKILKGGYNILTAFHNVFPSFSPLPLPFYSYF